MKFKFKKILLFIFTFLMIFFVFQRILLRKDGNYFKEKMFRNLKKNSIDLLLIGSSHNNNGFVPKVFDETLGLNSYNYGKTGARIEQVEFLLKEALKKQEPKILVIEGFSFTPIANKDKKRLYHWAFDAFPLSINKINAIKKTTNKNQLNKLFPILEYHERWRNLQLKDFELFKNYKLSEKKGWGSPNKEIKQNSEIDKWFNQNLSEIKDIRKIRKTQEDSLEEIIKICNAKNIELFIVTLPYKNQLDLNSLELVKVNNYLTLKYPELKILDLNKNYKTLGTNYTEFYNEGHLNSKGAYKYSKYVANYLKNHLGKQSISLKQEFPKGMRVLDSNLKLMNDVEIETISYFQKKIIIKFTEESNLDKIKKYKLKMHMIEKNSNKMLNKDINLKTIDEFFYVDRNIGDISKNYILDINLFSKENKKIIQHGKNIKIELHN